MKNFLSYKELEIIRLKSGVTRSEFARSLGVTYSAYKNWRNGSTHPSIPVCLLAQTIYKTEVKK